jgi:hypothetical protein
MGKSNLDMLMKSVRSFINVYNLSEAMLCPAVFVCSSKIHPRIYRTCPFWNWAIFSNIGVPWVPAEDFDFILLELSQTGNRLGTWRESGNTTPLVQWDADNNRRVDIAKSNPSCCRDAGNASPYETQVHLALRLILGSAHSGFEPTWSYGLIWYLDAWGPEPVCGRAHNGPSWHPDP